MHPDRHPLSPRLDHCPAGLPREAYLSADWFAAEMASLFAHSWIAVGRLADFAPGTMRPVQAGGASVIVARDAAGGLAAWHNTCPHRGAELCAGVQPLGALIRCPYHAWSFAAADGRLAATGHARPTADFDRAAHGLRPAGLRVWAGFVFVAGVADPAPLAADVPLDTLDNWPMADLVTGHSRTTDIACNWKVFWENYAECLHCPGVHPGLSDLVPVYARGIMAPSDAEGWVPGAPADPPLRPGAVTWTPDGRPCGPVFAALTAAERDAGHIFVTIWPTLYIVAHVDHVRAVRVLPLAPDRTRLVADWLFPPETLAQPGFDAAQVAAFAARVMDEDTGAAEGAQRGMRSPAFRSARLMPEEYEIHRFHAWVLAQMEGRA